MPAVAPVDVDGFDTSFVCAGKWPHAVIEQAVTAAARQTNAVVWRDISPAKGNTGKEWRSGRNYFRRSIKKPTGELAQTHFPWRTFRSPIWAPA